MRILPYLLLTCLLVAGPVAAADVGRVKVVSGPVHIERAGERIPAAADVRIQSTDTVVTGANGSVGITFIDDSRISAGPNSTLVINRYTFDRTTYAGVMDATLTRGTLAVASGRIAKQSPEAMTVRTSSIVLGVRGTEFLVYAE